jgi:hypothetical protein
MQKLYRFNVFSGQQAVAASGGRGVIPWLGHSVSQIARSAPASTFYSPLGSPIHSDEENELGEDSMERRAMPQETIEVCHHKSVLIIIIMLNVREK